MVEEKLTKEATDKVLKYLTNVSVTKFKQFELLDSGWFIGFHATDKNMYVNAVYSPQGLCLAIHKGTKVYNGEILPCENNNLAEQAKNNLDKLVSQYSPQSQLDELGL